MAKQLDNSLVRFSQHQRATPLTGLAVMIGILLAVGLVLAIVMRAWPLVAVSAISLISLAVHFVLNSRATRRLAAAHEEARIDWQAALPEMQRASLNIEVAELSRILEVTSEQVSDLQSAYIVAVDLALRQIQQEEQVPLLRHVTIGGVPFDAVFVKQDLLICGEVSFLVAPDLRQERIESMLRKMTRVQTILEQMNVGMRIRLMIILITQLTFEDEEQLRKKLNAAKKFTGTPVEIEIRFLDFEALQRIYVTD